MRANRAFLLVMVFVLWGMGIPLSAEGYISAESYILTEGESGYVLEGKDIHRRMEPASTTKILTAILVLEKGNPNDRLRVSLHAALTEGSSAGLKEGDELTVWDALHLLLMKSANDAAVALAEYIAGDESSFAELMNRKSESLGCFDSHFVNPHGLPDEEHYTTASDLSRIASYAMKNPSFAEIVSTEEYRTENGTCLKNSNRLLLQDERVIGIKTGFTKSAGRCLVTAADKEGVMLIAVTLNAPDDWSDHTLLYDRWLPRVEKVTLYEPYSYYCSRSVLGGVSRVKLTNKIRLEGVAVDGVKIPYEWREDIAPFLFAPFEAYSECGYLTLLCEGRSVTSVPLLTPMEVKSVSVSCFSVRFRNNFGKFIGLLL